MISFFKSKRLVSACLSFQIGKTVHVRWLPAHDQDNLLMHTKLGVLQIVTFKNTNQFCLGYFRFSWNTKWKEKFSFKNYYTFKIQVVAQTLWCLEILYFHLYWRAVTEEKDFHEDRGFFCFISCILLVLILCNTC